MSKQIKFEDNIRDTYSPVTKTTYTVPVSGTYVFNGVKMYLEARQVINFLDDRFSISRLPESDEQQKQLCAQTKAQEQIKANETLNKTLRERGIKK